MFTPALRTALFQVVVSYMLVLVEVASGVEEGPVLVQPGSEIRPVHKCRLCININMILSIIASDINIFIFI